MGGPYWPEAYCMETFFDKFEEIAKAEIRVNGKAKTKEFDNKLRPEEQI